MPFDRNATAITFRPLLSVTPAVTTNSRQASRTVAFFCFSGTIALSLPNMYKVASRQHIDMMKWSGAKEASRMYANENVNAERI